MLKAHSRNNAGTVTLRSADPQDMPAIDFNYFDTGVTDGGADEKDLQAVYEAMQFSRQIFEDLVPLQGDFEEVWPGPNVTTEEGMKDFIKQEAGSLVLHCCDWCGWRREGRVGLEVPCQGCGWAEGCGRQCLPEDSRLLHLCPRVHDQREGGGDHS